MMSNKNVWNRNKNATKKAGSKGLNDVFLQQKSEQKFKEAQNKLQEAVKKHVNYESSSEEEDVDTNLLGNIIAKYTSTGGDQNELGKTQKILENALQSGTSTCLICICKVKRNDQIWSCGNCYGYFHLMCIQRWSKDTVTQQKEALRAQIVLRSTIICWCCPKCRFEYKPEEIPVKYLCFCGKTENPKFDPFGIPHSCGDLCKKDLVPNCGHSCVLLCHPGPCPPCPATITITCYCKSQKPIPRRCSKKEWSCNNPCGKLLSCKKHNCAEPCHPGNCKPCLKKSIQKCQCGSKQSLRDCATPEWQCDKVCNKLLDCGNHKCQLVCHSGVCDVCELSKLRTCPCGKTKHQLPCTEPTPTCLDTCDKVLDCGMHTCNQRCHKDKCGLCLEIVVKSCRCGQHSKEIQCSKPYLCETKCKNMKDCNKHNCNRKCCDGNCPPCEKQCGRSLNCGQHKCSSICHNGPCFPCNVTHLISCKCGYTKIEVPCGKKNKTKPPKCPKLCLNKPDCHHEKRENHRCHFGDCPPCKQTCNKIYNKCKHSCTASCHDYVSVKVEAQKPSMPWEQSKPQIEKKCLPCPDCKVPISITCFGGHETVDYPCFMAKPYCCDRPCGRTLICNNHKCSLPCHKVTNLKSDASDEHCEECTSGCDKPRPEGCKHSCPLACHPDDCPPCKQMVRIQCHCGLTQPYVECFKLQQVENWEEVKSCGNQCPKNYECGHRCKSTCHSGPCPDSELCKKKMKVYCKCKRLKKEFQCLSVRNNTAKVECDEECLKKIEEERKAREAEEKRRLQEEELKKQKDLEEYQRKFENLGKRNKNRRNRRFDDSEEDSSLFKNKFVLMSVVILVLSIFIALIFLFL